MKPKPPNPSAPSVPVEQFKEVLTMFHKTKPLANKDIIDRSKDVMESKRIPKTKSPKK